MNMEPELQNQLIPLTPTSTDSQTPGLPADMTALVLANCDEMSYTFAFPRATLYSTTNLPPKRNETLLWIPTRLRFRTLHFQQAVYKADSEIGK